VARTDYGKLEIYCATVFVQRECDEYMFTCDIMDSKKSEDGRILHVVEA
jgi:hypothetical protein